MKIGVDLSPYAKKHNLTETITIPFKKDKDSKEAPMLKVSFHFPHKIIPRLLLNVFG